MTRNQRAKGFDGIHDPNLTPLIDVSLVLVVILLVATPMALQSGIAVSRSAASGRAGASVQAARVEITIPDDTHVIVNRTEVPLAAFGPVLQPLLAQSPTRDVVVRCGDGVAHGTFVEILDQAKALGATRIAVVGS